jgi:hypothetical protein
MEAPAGWHIETDAGVQQDRVGWNIGVGSPNVLSELGFRSTSIKGQVDLTYTTSDRKWLAHGRIGYGGIVSGTVRDQDFSQSNRQGLFSSSVSDAGGHDVQSYFGEAGYRLLDAPRGSLALLVGYRYDQQRFQIEDGRQEVPPGGADLSRLNSSYTAKWTGATLGALVELPVSSLPLKVELTGHFWPSVSYRGTGRWNLRSDFSQTPSFQHDATGYGGDLGIRLRYQPTEHWDVSIGWAGTWLIAEDGTDKTFFSNGTTGTADLNRVDSRTNFYSFGIGYRW